MPDSARAERTSVSARTRCPSASCAVSRSPGDVPAALRLLQRVSASLDIVQAVDERSHQAQIGIRPVLPQVRRFPEGDERIRKLMLRLCGEFPGFARFAVDPVQMALAVAECRLQPAIVSASRERAGEDTARRSPLGLSHRRRRRPVIGDHPIRCSHRLPHERTLEPGDANSQTGSAQLLVPLPCRVEIAQFLSGYLGGQPLRERRDPQLVGDDHERQQEQRRPQHAPHTVHA